MYINLYIIGTTVSTPSTELYYILYDVVQSMYKAGTGPKSLKTNLQRRRVFI